jgi:predicted O-methyltransferase YrrM
MVANAVLEEILTTRKVTDASGRQHALHAEVSREEGELLASLILKYSFTRTLEVGCAYGISSLYISDALARLERPVKHTIIDPFQNTACHGAGVASLERAGFRFFELVEKPSELALPALLAEGRTFQFAFIDGWHTFDHTLLDFFYINRLLEEGGVVAIDDVDMPGVRKVARYISNYPNYRLVTATHNQRPTLKRRIVEGAVRLTAGLLPRRLKGVFSDAWRRPDYPMGINASLVAFQKTGPDSRPWDWFAEF